MEQSTTASDSKKAFEDIQSLSYSRTTTLVASPTSPVNAKPPRSTDRHYWRMASAFLCFFAIGWGDACDYNVSFQLRHV
jgi:hypothetical protein